MQEVHPPLQVGTVIRGRYVVEDVLGKGGFGAVYLVTDRRNKQKLFVLKEVPKPGWKERFQFAFDSMVFRRPDHITLPHVYQVFNDSKHDRAFMLMDYIEGPNLETLRLGQPEQRFPLLQVMSLIAPIVDAVTHLHTQRHPIIHGNIKPSNIIIRKEGGAAVLVGFSLVKEAATDTTLTFDRYGSPGYKAPEYHSGVTDPRTDMYALGAVLYTLLTGSIPAGALYRVRHLVEKKPDPLISMNQIAPDIPTGIASTIHRALSIDRNDRYSTVDRFWNALWQEPIYSSMVQHTWEQLIAPSTEGNGDLDTKLREEEATEDWDAPPTEEKRELDDNLTEEEAMEDWDAPPTVDRKELDADPPLRPIAESGVVALAEETPIMLLDASPLWQQVTEPGITSIDPAHESILSEEVKRPITAPLQEQQQSNHSSKPRKIFLFSLFLLVTLLLSIGVGTSLLFFTANHQRPISAIPTPAGQLKPTLPATASPNAQVTVTPSPAATIYPKVAASYHGTISDIAANLSTQMSLSDIQQQQGNIRGNITGLRWIGSFQGSIDTGKHIQFSVTGNVGQATLTFDGNMQSDGNIGGTYCSSPNQAGDCSDYGIWSVAPVA